MADKEAFDVVFQRFLTNTRRWYDWVLEGKAPAERMRDAALARPRGLTHDGNIWKAPDGSIWQMRRGANGVEEVTRTEPFGQYTPTGKTLETWGDHMEGWVRSSWHRPEDDWAWRPDRYGNGMLGYVTASLASTVAGLAFGDALMRVDPERLKAWMMARGQSAPLVDASTQWEDARGTVRDRQHVNDDWKELVKEFQLPDRRHAYGSDLPDTGSVLCTLHAAIDAASPSTMRVGYAH